MKKSKNINSANTPQYSAQDIFYWFISRNYYQSTISTIYDTEMFSYNKILLLLYCAQAEYLYINHKPLFKEKIIAGKYLPIIEEIAEKYKGIYTLNDYENIRNNDTDWYDWVKERSEKQRKELSGFLEMIYWNYGRYDTCFLIEVYQEENYDIGKKISKKKLKKNFSKSK